MASLRRSLFGFLTLSTLSLSALVAPTTAVHADAGDAVAGTPRAFAGLITAGEKHTCVLTSEPGATAGTVRCWGNNTLGQLGLGDTENRGDGPGEMGDALPAVDLGRPATQVAAGFAHTCAILDDGAVTCWGVNTNHQLGTADTDIHGDDPGEMGADLPRVDLGAGRTATMITAGVGHTCALLDNGVVRCWGDDSLGQLGHDIAVDKAQANMPTDVDLGPNRTAISISAGASHTCAILDTHQVKCWGSAELGQLGYGDTNHRGDQPGEMGAALPTVDLGTGATARAITTGRFHTCAQLDDLRIRCWGLNADGQLGQRTTETRGDQPGEMGDALPVLDLATWVDRISGLTATAFGTCATGDAETTEDEQIVVISIVRCWGDNDHGQLGRGNTTDVGTGPGPVDLSSILTGPMLAAAGGGDHVCVVTRDANVRCLGANDSGQLGYGDTQDRGDDAGEIVFHDDVELLSTIGIVDIATGAASTCAVVVGGNVRCWGSNVFGQLGYGDTDTRGDDIGEIGDNLPFVDLGTGRTATSIDANDGTTCAVLDNGQLKCWGANQFGQLGLGDTNARGDQPGEMGDALPAIDLGTGRTAVMVKTGLYNTCAILDNGSLKCWGYGFLGLLAQGNTATRGDQPGELGDNLPAINLGAGRTALDVVVANLAICALLDDHSIACWGYGSTGTLGQDPPVIGWGDTPAEAASLKRVELPTGRTAVAIDGYGTLCAILDDASVVCWGRNEYGEAGVGTTNAIGDNAGEMGDNLVRVPMPTGETPVDVHAGARHMCLEFDSGKLQCWGDNTHGTLGIDQDDPARGDEPGEMGNALPFVDFGAGLAPLARVETGGSHSCAVFGSDRVTCWGWVGSGALGTGGGTNVGGTVLHVADAPRTVVGGVTHRVLPFHVTPGIPTAVAATAGERQVTLTWNAPRTDGGSPVTGYRIERSTDGSSWSVAVANTGSTSTTHVVTGLASGQSIRFRIAAINARGASPASLPSADVAPTEPGTGKPPVDPPPPPPAAPGYVALQPARIADTRPDGETVDGIGRRTGVLAAGQTLTVQVTGRASVPAGATAAAFNVTAVFPEGPGYLTVYPCGADRPSASSVNYQAGQVVPNAVISKLAADGTVCIYTLTATHVIVDVNGAYPAGAAYVPVDPARIADTRPDGETIDGIGRRTGILRDQTVAVLTVQVAGRANVPAGATAAVLNVTAVTPQGPGYLTVFPCDRDQPNASSLNYRAGQIVANAVVTKLAADGTVCIASLVGTHVIVDVNGAFTAGAAYTPLVPARLADTRADGITVDGAGRATGLVGAGQTLRVQFAGRDQVPAGATSAVLNVTAVLPQGPGYLTVYPCDAERPLASSVNYQAGQVVPNAVISKLAADGSVCIYTLAATHVVVDVVGVN